MKKLASYSFLAFGVAVLAPSLFAEKEVTKKELRLLTTSRGPEAPRESVTFLGIETSPVDPTLTEQLGLAKGIGLVVRTVVHDSPAINVLKAHDILTKLNDQLLIETRQLAVLIRSFKEGDEVTLTFIRGGKEMSAKVKLTKREMPPLLGGYPSPRGFGEDHLINVPGGPPRNLFFAMPDHPLTPESGTVRSFRLQSGKGPGAEATAINVENSHLLFSDDQGSLDLTIKDGQKSLLAKNAKGEKIFEGPVDSPDQRQAMPAQVRERLDTLENMNGVSFEAGSQFQGERSGFPTTQELPPGVPTQRTFRVNPLL